MHDNSARNSFRIGAAIFAAAFGVALPAFAAGAAHLPPEHVEGAIAYRSGGIGLDESMAMKEEASRYPLEVLFVEHDPDGAAGYLAGERVSIRDHNGKEILDTVSDGPFLLARLPEGRYTVTAWRDGNAKEHNVTIVPHKHQRVAFEW